MAVAAGAFDGHAGTGGVMCWLIRTVAAAALAMPLAISSAASEAPAQAPPAENHEKHHPPRAPAPSEAPAPPGRPTKPTPTLPVVSTPSTGMEMMKEMERMMGVPAKKPPVGRLLDVERLSEAERNSLKGDAARQSDEGLRLLREAGGELEAARRKGDQRAIERAVGKLREGATLWETGHAVEQALGHPAPAARAAGLRWFKAQMNLDAQPSAVTGLPWGISWMHLVVMAALAVFVVGAISLYLYRVRRALGLLARLTRREAPK